MNAVIDAPIRENITGYTDHIKVPAHANAFISNLNQKRNVTVHKIRCGNHIFFVFIYDKQPYINEYNGKPKARYKSLKSKCNIESSLPLLYRFA